MERKTDEKEKEKSPADINTGIYHYGMYSACYFCTDIAGEIKDKYIREYEQSGRGRSSEVKSVSETLLYAITTDEEFLSLVVNANDSEEIPEADAYNMRRDFAHICNRNEGVDGIQLVLSDKRRIFYDRLSSSSVNSTWMEKVKIPDETKLLSYDVDKDTDNPERMFHIGRKVDNYWDISEDLGYVILSVNLDELESVLSAGKGSRVYLVKDGVIVGAEDTKMLGRQEKALDSAKVNQKAIKNARSGWSILLCQSIREYQKAIEEQVIFWIMVALAVLLIFVLLIYRVTKPVMISVNDIVDAMKKIISGKSLKSKKKTVQRFRKYLKDLMKCRNVSTI